MLCALGDMRLLFVIVAVQRCQFPESQDLSLFGAHLSKKWKNACPLSRRITPMSSVKMEQEKKGTCALWLFVSPKSSAPGIFPIAKISEPPKSRTCPSHLPFCQKGIFESYLMCLVSGRFCTYPTLCHLPLI